MSVTLDEVSFLANHKTILKPTSATLKKGEITAIVGPNGSAKSTLLKIMAGEIKPSSGRISIDAQPTKKWSRNALAKKLTLLPQTAKRPSGMRVVDLVACGRYPYTGSWRPFSQVDHQAVSWALEITDLSHLQQLTIDHLSGGEMQRVWLAMILAQQTDVILLDEPTSYLDMSHQHALLTLIKQLNHTQKITVAWVLHDLNQAMQYSDRVWVMHQGEKIHEGPVAILLDNAILEKVFAIRCDFTTVNETPVLVPRANVLGVKHQLDSLPIVC